MADNNDFLLNSEILKKVNDLLEKQKSIVQDLNKQKELRIKLEREERFGTADMLKGQGQLAQIMDEVTTKTIEYEASLEMLTEQKKNIESLVITLENLKDAQSNATDQEQINLYEKSIQSVSSSLAEAKRNLEEFKNLNSKIVKEGESLEVGKKVSDNILGAFTKNFGLKNRMPFSKSLIGKVLAGDKASLKTGFKAVKGNIGTFLSNPLNTFGALSAQIGLAFVNQMKDMAKQMDEVGASLARTTGQGRGFAYEVRNSYNELRQFGLTTKEVGIGLETLFENTLAFTDQTKVQRKELIKTTAQMTKFGITASSSATFFDEAISSLGMTTGQAISTMNKLTASAIALSLSPKEVIRGFNQARETLAAYGKQSIKVFQEIMAASKETAIPVGKLISTFSKFDTFESAAQSAGRLNAILGGNLLNATQMLMATEAERVELVQQGLRASGLQYELLGKFERKSIGEALGISDISTLNKLFIAQNQQLSERELALKALSVSQEDLNKAQRAGATLSEKMSALWSALGVAVLPIVDGLNAIIDSILSANDSMENLLIPSGLALVAITAAVFAGFGPIAAVVGAIGAAVVGLSFLFEELKDQTEGIKNVVIVLGGVLMTGLLGPIVPAVMLAVGAFQYLRDNFAEIKKQVLDGIQPAIESLRETFKGVGGSEGMGSMMDMLKKIGGFIVKGVVPVVIVLVNHLLSIVNIIARVGSAIYKFIQIPMALMKGDFSKAGDLMVGVFKDIGMAVVEIFKMIWNQISYGPKAFLDNFIGPTENLFASFMQKAKDMFEELISYFTLDATIEKKNYVEMGAVALLKSAAMSSPLGPLVTAYDAGSTGKALIQSHKQETSKIATDMSRTVQNQKRQEYQVFNNAIRNNNTVNNNGSGSENIKLEVNLDGKKMTDVVVNRMNNRVRGA